MDDEDSIRMIYGMVQFTNNESCCLALSSNSSMSKIYTYIILSLTPFNVLGNLFALLILSDKIWNNSVFSTILKAISIFEVMFNLLFLINFLTIIYEPLVPFRTYGDQVVAIVEITLLLLDSLIIGSQMARNWSVTVLAFFRYNMVCRATVVRRNNNDLTFFSNKILPGFFAAMFLVFFTFSVPRMFEIYPIICQSTATICNYETNWINNKFYQYGYMGVGMFLFQSGGPIIITSYVSLMVIRKIRYRARLRNRQGMSTSKQWQKSQQNPGTLVLAVCVTFAVLELPSFFNKLEAFMQFKIGPNFKYVANSLVCLDSSLNLFIYLASNRTFRILSFNRIRCRKTTQASLEAGSHHAANKVEENRENWKKGNEMLIKS